MLRQIKLAFILLISPRSKSTQRLPTFIEIQLLKQDPSLINITTTFRTRIHLSFKWVLCGSLISAHVRRLSSLAKKSHNNDALFIEVALAAGFVTTRSMDPNVLFTETVSNRSVFIRFILSFLSLFLSLLS